MSYNQEKKTSAKTKKCNIVHYYDKRWHKEMFQSEIKDTLLVDAIF